MSNFGQADAAAVFGTVFQVNAQPFTTGSVSGGYTLSSIEVKANSGLSASGRNEVRAELWSSGATRRPASKLADLTVPATVSAGTVRFTAPVGTTLSPNITYNLVVYTTDFMVDFGVKTTASTDEDSNRQAGWSIWNESWQAIGSDTPGGTWNQNTAALMQIRVNGAAVAPGVSLSVSPNPVDEGSDLTVEVTLPEPLPHFVEIPLVYPPMPVTSEPDDVTGPKAIVVLRGETKGMTTWQAHHDTDTEDEVFTIALDTANLPAGLVADTSSSVRVTIKDDDAPPPDDTGGGGGGGGGGTPPDDDDDDTGGGGGGGGGTTPTAPTAPRSLTAAAGDGEVELTWEAPARTGGAPIRNYEYRHRSSGGTWSGWISASGTSVTVTDLTNGTAYEFEVRAVNRAGEGPAAAISATPGRPPGAPAGLTARAGSETVTLTWGAPADDGGAAITGYEVCYQVSGSSAECGDWRGVEGGANAASHTWTGLANGVDYTLEVRAVNAVGAGASASVEATPMARIDFAHFANGQSGGVTITSEIVLVNVETTAEVPAIYFYDQAGGRIAADSVVEVMGDLELADDGALTLPRGIPGRGEVTISTHGEGDLVIGSAKVIGSGRLSGVLRFDIPTIGVAGVGASEPVGDALFPARRTADGLRTGVAIRNLGGEALTVTCRLMQDGQVLETARVELDGEGHHSRFIDELFPATDTAGFVGSVRCTAAEGGVFAGLALEMDAAGGIFTTLPVAALDSGAEDGESRLDFAHFANGEIGGTATSTDLVFVNVASTAVSPAIHFYDQRGNMIDASMVVDAMTDGVEVGPDGALTVTREIPPLGERTISTSGEGEGVVGSVRVVSDGPVGGVLRFAIATLGVAGVGASEAVNAAIFPARRRAGGINTGAAIRNLMSEELEVICRLMAGGQRQRMGETAIALEAHGQSSLFLHEMFPDAGTDGFEGAVHCAVPSGSRFTGVALEMDFNHRIFTTLPLVPIR